MRQLLLLVAMALQSSGNGPPNPARLFATAAQVAIYDAPTHTLRGTDRYGRVVVEYLALDVAYATNQ